MAALFWKKNRIFFRKFQFKNMVLKIFFHLKFYLNKPPLAKGTLFGADQYVKTWKKSIYEMCPNNIVHCDKFDGGFLSQSSSRFPPLISSSRCIPQFRMTSYLSLKKWITKNVIESWWICIFFRSLLISILLLPFTSRNKIPTEYLMMIISQIGSTIMTG